MNGNGQSMLEMIRTDLSASGHPHLAAEMVLGSNGRPLWSWRTVPTKHEVQLVHAAMLRAYEAYAPDEVGEEVDNFTRSPEAWMAAIGRVRHRGDAGASAATRT